MKKNSNLWAGHANYLTKLFRIMRLTLFLLVFGAVQLFAEDSYAQSKKLSLDFENVKAETILDEIENRSEFYFLYNQKLVNVDFTTTAKFENKTIFEALEILFKGRNVTYQVEGRQIILSNSSLPLFQQQKTVAGKVVDENGEPIPGASIVVKGTIIGTISDLNGNFTLSGVPEDAVLQFSFVGMETLEIPVGNQTTFEVTMVQGAIGLDEVVTIGYASVKKSVITGAISSVKMETVQPIATQRVDQMLQGRASGVLVLNTDGSPGGNTTIRIRGMNSILGGNSALIVVDGFQGGDLTAINPRDIESIEILKDAAATAIYGAQGANGVVLIETKRGKTDKPTINYSSEVGVSNILMGGIELMNAAQYARDQNANELANNFERTPIPPFTDAQITQFEKTGGTNWIDEVYRTGITQTHQISLSGRTKVLNYYASGSLYDQKGIMLNSGYKRYSLRANLTADINSWLKIDLNWDASQQDKSGPQFGGQLDWPGNPVMGALQFAPTIPVYDENGNYSGPNQKYGDPILWNPVASALESLNENATTANNVRLYFDFTLMKGLTLRVGGAARYADFNARRFFNKQTFAGSQDNGQGYAYYSKNKDYQSSNVLNYTNTFGKHYINAILVGEVKHNNSFSFEADNKDFTVHETSVYNLGGANIQRTSSDFGERDIYSAVTRVNYAYDDKYVFAASYRADGSSVFGTNNKWAYFPSLSVGWRLSNETFVSDLGLFDNLMIRASWGKTGNQAISTYQTLSRISGNGVYPWDGGGSANLGFQISSASNPNLKWETTTQSNIGLDLGIFRNRLRFSVEYYDKVTDDLLMARELSRTTGLPSVIDNVGSMGNKGWEFTVDGDINIRSLKWTAGLSFTRSTTTVLDLGSDKFLSYKAGGSGHGVNIPTMFLEPGKPFGEIKGFGYEGTWKIGEEKEAAVFGQLPGDPRYTDVNGDGKIDYDHDFKVIGNAMPKFIFGITNQLRLKNWELTFLWQGTYGNDLFNVARSKRESDPSGYSINKLNRWTPENQNTDVPALLTEQYRHDYQEAWNAANPENLLTNTITFPSSGNQAISRWIEDASYIRLKNLTVGYNLLINKGVSNLRVFASATNLFTFTKYSGFDPEVSSFTGSDGQLGTDYNNYPPSRYFSIGVDLTF